MPTSFTLTTGGKLCFVFNNKQRNWSVQLIYDKIELTLPTRVMVTEEGKKNRWKELERIFKEEQLPSAWKQVFQ